MLHRLKAQRDEDDGEEHATRTVDSSLTVVQWVDAVRAGGSGPSSGTCPRAHGCCRTRLREPLEAGACIAELKSGGVRRNSERSSRGMVWRSTS